MVYKITNMLFWFENIKYIQDEHGQIALIEKPVFSFIFDSIRYYWNEQIYIQNGEQYSLSAEQQNEIETFIKNKREEVGILKPAVDKEGLFLGIKRIDSPDVYAIVSTTPPTADSWIWDFEQEQWARIFYYDSEYNIVYNSEDSIGFTKKPYPQNVPLPHKFSVEKDDWVYFANSDTTSRIKNKAMLDVLETYLLTLVSVQNSPTKEKEILDYIANLLKNDDYVINVVNENSPNLHSHFSTAITSISNEENDALNAYVESVDFKSYSTKQIGKVLYNANQETVADIVVEESLKTNT